MSDRSEDAVPIHAGVMRALKDIVAHAVYRNVAPVTPDYATLMQRVAEIERPLAVPS
jgi:hypothetical protein